MRTHKSDSRIALQPENEVEQSLVSELFARLNNITEAAEHPTNVGSRLVYYTLDLQMYDDLNLNLWGEAECGVDEHGRLDPSPGSRALVAIFDPEKETQADSEVEEAVESVAEAESGDGNEYTIDRAEFLSDVEAILEQDGPEYSELQEAAKKASSLGFDIPANQSTSALEAELETFLKTAQKGE